MVLMARPRRTLRVVTWPGMPGVAMVGGEFTHTLLPGWGYTAKEFRTEMLEDLDRLAQTGERPMVATR